IMYCPSCGSEERQLSQFCRLCGTDLRAVRAGMERPDVLTDSAATARTEIGRAIADRIRELESGDELKRVAEDVLPQIEKFLESPEEKRLRRMRAGMITAAASLGATLMFLLVAFATGQEELIAAVGASLVAFCIGLGMIINGKIFTVRKREEQDSQQEAALKEILGDFSGATSTQRKLQMSSNPPLSVTENTTHRLPNEALNVRRSISDES
ncbi:MAG TPA: hypothetical protein VKB86_11395, partial [Pyrinomonadaceae bacterium]|nr:hypothetical protein [Pyrinomonadaceae bacterium]